MDELIKILNVEALPDQRIRLTFSDGVIKIVDVGKLVKGSYFEPSFMKKEVFNAVSIYPYGRGIYWPNEFDLCPDTLRYYMEGQIEQSSMA